MDQARFETELVRDGFTAAVAGGYEPRRSNPVHTHPFELRGLVLTGLMIVRTAEGEQVCGPGDIFQVGFGCTHTETVGDEGVTYVYGTKQKA